jgi:hypothetical protein
MTETLNFLPLSKAYACPIGPEDRGSLMQLVLKYERHAAECRQMAVETKNPQFKRQLEDMAEVWERLAAERRKGIVENDPDSV